MRTLVFFLEEPSAKAMLEGVLPRIVSDEIDCHYYIFNGKQDLEKHLPHRLRYWQKPDSVFVVLRDQDAGDCLKIKENLRSLCKRAGKKSVLLRIACRELESFYLGDLSAVEKGLEISGLARQQNKRKFRDPDKLGKPSHELEGLTKGWYQKVSGSRKIAPHLNLTENRSHSFNVLITGIKNMVNHQYVHS